MNYIKIANLLHITTKIGFGNRVKILILEKIVILIKTAIAN